MGSIKLFESKQIRSVWNDKDQKWYFSVQDVIEVLTDSTDVKQYIKRMLSRDEMLKSNWGTICTLVEMEAADGKRRKIQASDTKGLLRIIQSIPSPKAEPFKLWLAIELSPLPPEKNYFLKSPSLLKFLKTRTPDTNVQLDNDCKTHLSGV